MNRQSRVKYNEETRSKPLRSGSEVGRGPGLGYVFFSAFPDWRIEKDAFPMERSFVKCTIMTRVEEVRSHPLLPELRFDQFSLVRFAHNAADFLMPASSKAFSRVLSEIVGRSLVNLFGLAFKERRHVLTCSIGRLRAKSERSFLGTLINNCCKSSESCKRKVQSHRVATGVEMLRVPHRKIKETHTLYRIDGLLVSLPIGFKMEPHTIKHVPHWKNQLTIGFEMKPHAIKQFTQKLKLISRASLTPELNYIAKPAASWLDDFLVWLSPEAFGCCRKFTNGSYCPPDDQPPCCFPDEGFCDSSEGVCRDCTTCFRHSDLVGDRPTTEQFKEKLPWFLNSLPSADCAKGGHGAYTNSVNLKGYEIGIIKASEFRSYHTPLNKQGDYVNALRAAKEFCSKISDSLKCFQPSNLIVLPSSFLDEINHDSELLFPSQATVLSVYQGLCLQAIGDRFSSSPPLQILFVSSLIIPPCWCTFFSLPFLLPSAAM
ncbi:Niemann-Pick C1 protein-like isoform X2 [Cucumis melo var. makuwa]|uniref:Niemann-Pick C1 protein-like isoform X2 n=1 Tax=Cucumis melo var. makuwa TaxID=1194695 RepID=A0A5D3BVM6_CUCMM|nr:Niemann-Pick C1 protein-like isoform X2 [Cucumis melo var. makuwa]